MPLPLNTWAGFFHDALAFLTRLVPPRSGQTAYDPNISLFFAPVGFCLGALLALTAWGAQNLAMLVTNTSWLSAMLAAWLWLSLDAWITRGLHWDGLADLADATGSLAHGDRFRQILKDSRLGAFGAIQLLLVFCGHWLGVAGHLVQGHLLLLLLASTWARTSALWLAGCTPMHTTADLGNIMSLAARPYVRGAHILLGALLLFLPVLAESCSMPQMLFTGLVQCALLLRLSYLARREGGLSGDFFGACIQWSQLCFLLCTL